MIRSRRASSGSPQMARSGPPIALAQEKLGRAAAAGAAAAGAVTANSTEASETIANIGFLIIMRRSPTAAHGAATANRMSILLQPANVRNGLYDQVSLVNRFTFTGSFLPLVRRDGT